MLWYSFRVALYFRFNRYTKKRGGSKESQQSDLMIDLGKEEEVAGAAALSTDIANLSLSSQLSSIPIVTANTANSTRDEFDMFAQSRKSTYQSSKAG